jgi:TolB-like protein
VPAQPALCVFFKGKVMKKALLWVLLPALLLGLLGCAANRARQVQRLKAGLSRYVQQGDNYLRRGQARYAYKHYTTTIRLYSRYRGELRTETARLYVERGKVALAMRYPKKAEVDFNEAKQLCPGIEVSVSGSTADVKLPPADQPPPPPAKPYVQPPPAVTNPTNPPPPPRADVPRVKIAILDFEEPPATKGKGYGTSFSNMMTNEMSRSSLFAVIERSILDRIMAERNLSQTDLLAKAASEGDKKILSVKYLLYGSITVEGNAVTVTARLIDWGNGRTLLSDMSKRLVGQGTSPSYYFDEIAADLVRKLEGGFVRLGNR